MRTSTEANKLNSPATKKHRKKYNIYNALSFYLFNTPTIKLLLETKLKEIVFLSIQNTHDKVVLKHKFNKIGIFSVALNS